MESPDVSFHSPRLPAGEGAIGPHIQEGHSTPVIPPRKVNSIVEKFPTGTDSVTSTRGQKKIELSKMNLTNAAVL